MSMPSQKIHIHTVAMSLPLNAGIEGVKYGDIIDDRLQESKDEVEEDPLMTTGTTAIPDELVIKKA